MGKGGGLACTRPPVEGPGRRELEGSRACHQCHGQRESVRGTTRQGAGGGVPVRDMQGIASEVPAREVGLRAVRPAPRRALDGDPSRTGPGLSDSVGVTGV
jgi:hypothetical protein